MKDEELLALRGGDGICCVFLQPGTHQVMGYMGASNQQQCHDACYTCGWDGGGGTPASRFLKYLCKILLSS